MTQYLLFSVTGPFAAFSTVSQGKERRPTGTYMTRSNVLGLLAAAMGFKHTDARQHSLLARAYRVAVLMRSEAGKDSHLLTDYHTSQSTPADRTGYRYRAYTRAQFLRHPELPVKTSVTHREYRTDVDLDVAIWRVNKGAETWDLKELAKALRTPKFVLYIGRKACPLAAPCHPVCVEAEDVCEALLNHTANLPRHLGEEKRRPEYQLVSDIGGFPRERAHQLGEQPEPVDRSTGAYRPRPCLILNVEAQYA